MCLFCIAVFAVLVGAVTTAVLDALESRLSSVAEPGSVQRLTDSDSAATIACTVAVPTVPGGPPPRVRTAPVLLTVYKREKRIRIQVQTHEISETEAHALQDRVATACGLNILSRSSHATQRVVQTATQEAQRVAPSAEAVPGQSTRVKGLEA